MSDGDVRCVFLLLYLCNIEMFCFDNQQNSVNSSINEIKRLGINQSHLSDIISSLLLHFL